MSELLTLAERCEAATGPDRVLDAEIACAVKFKNRRPAQPTDFDGKFGYSPGNIKVETGFLMSDRFTASLDAAMTLVPEGLSVALYVHPDESHADVYRIHPSKGRLGEAEQAKSPALAVCAAALRARSSVTVRGE